MVKTTIFLGFSQIWQHAETLRNGLGGCHGCQDVSPLILRSFADYGNRGSQSIEQRSLDPPFITGGTSDSTGLSELSAITLLWLFILVAGLLVFAPAAKQRVLNELLTSLLVAGLVAFVAAMVGGYIMARRALAPIDQMTRLKFG